MPLDPNIALSFKPSVALADPMQQYEQAQKIQSNALVMRQARNENALAQQSALDKQVFGKIMADSIDPNTGTVDYRKAALLAAKLAPSHVSEINATGLKTEADTQAAAKDRLSNVKTSFDLSRERLNGVDTKDKLIAWSAENHRDPFLKGWLEARGVDESQSRATIEALPDDPAAIAAYVQKAALGSVEFQKTVEAQANRDTQIEVQGMIGQRMEASRAARPTAPARAATGGGGARPSANAPAAAGRPGKPGKTPLDPAVVAASQDEKINRIRAALTEADALIGPTTTGVIGEVASRVGGTKARDLSGKLETIKANLGFDELQKMRDASPTGGALGQVAVKELIALQATVASLDQGLSEKELKKSIKKIEQHYNSWYEAVLKARSGAQPAAVTKASPNAKLYDEADAILNRGRK